MLTAMSLLGSHDPNTQFFKYSFYLLFKNFIQCISYKINKLAKDFLLYITFKCRMKIPIGTKVTL